MRKHWDWLLPNALIALIALAGLSGPRPVAAYTDVVVSVSSSFPSRVVVDSGTATNGGALRIDNWNRGKQGTTASLLLPLRVSVCWQNADSADSVFCGFNSDVSSDTATFDGVITSSITAWEVKAGDLMCVDADRSMAVWCKAADAAGAAGALLSVQQFGKIDP